MVWTPKYRFKILRNKIGKELYRSIYILCNMKECEVLELNIQYDHVHLVVIAPPKLSISGLMGTLKGRTAIRLFNKFLHIRKKQWGNHFWARGYFVDTIGVNEVIIRRYVRHQDKQDIEHERQLGLLD
ncbi:IS200/IS605 family transposase [Dongshaea marina]|uniref:IS200/IS605 family transposase n=1 Tax=Dongshaea marina TaxID=2047966 RepID=UPI001F23A74F|nr:IS200/IS605 family transposase [Dongshaea marina]